MKKYLITILSFSPLLALAQGKIRSIDSNSFTGLVNSLSRTLNQWVIPLLVLISLAYFIFGAITYIGENEDTKRQEKKQKMFWGVIALFVMLSVWGLVYIIADTFNIDTRGNNASFYSTFNKN